MAVLQNYLQLCAANNAQPWFGSVSNRRDFAMQAINDFLGTNYIAAHSGAGNQASINQDGSFELLIYREHDSEVYIGPERVQDWRWHGTRQRYSPAGELIYLNTDYSY